MRPIEVVRKLAPHAKPQYLEAFENGDALFAAAGITTPLRLAHFLAQTAEETGGYTIFVESGNYSAERIRVVWPSRPGAVAYAHNAEALFNDVYANRMGNGPPSSGDGFKFRGRGVLQTTGREAYRKYGKKIGVDLEANPDLICDPRYILQPALGEWTDSHCNELADKEGASASHDETMRAITKRVNGGYTNIAEREVWYRKFRPAITSVELTGAPSKPQKPPVAPPVTDSTKNGTSAVIAVGGAAVATTAHYFGFGTGVVVGALAIGLLVAAVVWIALHNKQKAVTP